MIKKLFKLRYFEWENLTLSVALRGSQDGSSSIPGGVRGSSSPPKN